MENQGTVELNLTRTLSDGTTSSVKSPKLVVGLRNFYSRAPAPINGTDTYNLPLCGGGQPITLSVAGGETYAGIPSETITDHIWTIPSTWGISGTGLVAFNSPIFPAPAGYQLYRAGNIISVTPAVGEGNRVVVVRFYSRICSETYSQANPIVSLPRQIAFVREPTITVANVPATVKCGEVISFTPTATASQSGSVTFAYSVPANSGWGIRTIKGVLYVSSSGSNGTTLTVTPTYTCGASAYTGTPKNVTIGFDPAQAKPTFAVSVLELCPGETKRIGASLVPGATSYSISGITAPLTWVQPNPAYPVVDISAPASLITAVAQTLQVTATSGYGCAPTTASIPVKAGYGNSTLSVYPTPEMVGSQPTVCANSTLNFSLNEEQAIGTSTEFEWTGNGCTVMPYLDGARVVSVVAPNSGSFSVSLRYKDGCGAYRIPLYSNPNYNTSLFTATSINGIPCAAPGQQRIAVYPNPAAGSLTVEHLRGDVRLYSAQGQPVWQAQVPAGTSARINTRSLPNGLYYIAGTDDAGQPARQTVQIQH
ncbi:MAG: hypothetical protein JWP58_103 [Hymenobacter sp.]|nr:hypothetical protein [Hymenobacter sp.]